MKIIKFVLFAVLTITLAGCPEDEHSEKDTADYSTSNLEIAEAGVTGQASKSISCTAMFPMQRGLKFQQSTYKADGILDSFTDAVVTNVVTANGRVTATFDLVFSNVKSNTITTTQAKVDCNGDITYFDPSQLIPPEIMDRFFTEGHGSYHKSPMEIPYNLKIGDELSNYYLEVNGSYKGIDLHFSSQTYGRTVVGKETVEIDAGTFDCYVIESVTHIIIDPIGMAETKTGKHWVAKGVGTVKLENFKNGELENYTLLTGFQR